MKPRTISRMSRVMAGAATLALLIQQTTVAADISGELKQWHNVTLTFSGPSTGQAATPNPFTDYRLNVTFTKGQASMTVPGYYATDGKGGASGNKWRVHFSPPSTGQWAYTASFRTGANVNVSLDENAGTATSFNGETGNFTVEASDKSGLDFRSPEKGLIRNRGHHYLTFSNGAPWVKNGPNIPENWLAHSFSAHGGHKGALDYIASKGVNSIYFLPMNIGGDGKDTWPTISQTDKTRYDNAKCAAWEELFSHAESKGIFLHFVLAETESGCENYHDNGGLGPERKLYYRELLARFGHYNGIQMNIGEENDYGTAKRKEFAAYIKAVDPYDHPVTTHTHGNQYTQFYDPLLGNRDFDITSFQGNNSGTSMADLIASWRRKSANAGVPWAISFDEPQKIENDKNDDNAGYSFGRRMKMWPCYMGGGAGFEWYVQKDGGGHGLDQAIDDYRIMDVALEWAGHALSFLGMLPLLDMAPDRGLGGASSGNTYVLAQKGEVYALYNDRCGKGLTLDLAGVSGTFDVKWFDPRGGGALRDGSVSAVDGGGTVSLGSAPDAQGSDWAVLVTRSGGPSGVRAVIDASSRTGDAPLTVDFDGSQSTGKDLTWSWDFGDPASGNKNTASGDTASHTYTARGVYTVTLTVTRADVSRTATTTITVTGLRPADDPAATAAGLEYAYYEGTFQNLPDFGSMTPAKSGTIDNFDISGFSSLSYGVVFSGYLDAPADGQYRFYTSSNDGSRLYIGDELVVDNDGMHTPKEESGTIGLKKGTHAIAVHYFQAGGTQALDVLWEGPGIASKSAVPDSVLSRVSASTGIAPPHLQWVHASTGGSVNFYTIHGRFLAHLDARSSRSRTAVRTAAGVIMAAGPNGILRMVRLHNRH